MSLRTIFAVIISISCSYTFAANKLQIVTSIKPLYNIASAIVDPADADVHLILQGNTSPHDYQLKPSDAQKIAAADLLIWVGPELESFLQQQLQPYHAKTIRLSEEHDLHLLAQRDDTCGCGHSHSHGHTHDHADSHHQHIDPHLWLNPNNAVAIAALIKQKLSSMLPAKSSYYTQKYMAFNNDMQQAISKWHAQLQGLQTKNFIVLHDGYQYFAEFFEIKILGSIGINPEIPLSAKRIAAITKLLAEKDIACIFTEPQFSNKIIARLTENTTVKTAMIDPLGSDEDLGANGYFKLIDKIVASISTGCK